MDEIKTQIDNLIKDAKQGQYYKERYAELQGEIKNILKRLNELTAISIYGDKRPRIGADTIPALIEDIYIILKSDENKEISTDDIKQKIEERNIKAYASRLSIVCKTLANRPGIDIRRDRNRNWYFYSKARERPNDIKFSKVSVMG